MKKLIAYIVGISVVVGGYALYKQNKNSYKIATMPKTQGLTIKSITLEPTKTPESTYQPTYIIHHTDGTIEFKADINYLNELNPSTTPETVIVTHYEDGSINFKKK